MAFKRELRRDSSFKQVKTYQRLSNNSLLVFFESSSIFCIVRLERWRKLQRLYDPRSSFQAIEFIIGVCPAQSSLQVSLSKIKVRQTRHQVFKSLSLQSAIIRFEIKLLSPWFKKFVWFKIKFSSHWFRKFIWFKIKRSSPWFTIRVRAILDQTFKLLIHNQSSSDPRLSFSGPQVNILLKRRIRWFSYKLVTFFKICNHFKY